MNKKSILNLFLVKLKFAIASSVATITDYITYLGLVSLFFSPVISNIISYSIGMVINFIIQKKFVFLLKRKVMSAFLISLGFSIIGLLLSTFLIWLLNQNLFLSENQHITKLLAIGIVFFYNFYTKRIAFEKSPW